ncbi:hypothetical protein [Paeniglutamicibacter gangotriensis]|uniref:Uncharacterized protein n=1 Tax=Paeniglutamicibacter gangotriensis Lz1y TaxID=1276920 RepID=M7MMI6_9MICC|nr:hypothetical protein [Paeniglutamicibacter gangotriensis]EMQ97562.1 hypothetical protein ADIAG_02942 [Paeniglutamicibacter gangotriensis Lz1y]
MSLRQSTNQLLHSDATLKEHLIMAQISPREYSRDGSIARSTSSKEEL